MTQENLHQKAVRQYNANTDKVVELILKDSDLHDLDTVFEPQAAEVCRRGYSEIYRIM